MMGRLWFNAVEEKGEVATRLLLMVWQRGVTASAAGGGAMSGDGGD
jgi:hypothetical protein